MVAICFKCNRDVDTLENPHAGHSTTCPLWTTCYFCNNKMIKTDDGKSFTIKVRQFNKSMNNGWDDINVCLSCDIIIRRLKK
jgi:hypothetical protein